MSDKVSTLKYLLANNKYENIFYHKSKVMKDKDKEKNLLLCSEDCTSFGNSYSKHLMASILEIILKLNRASFTKQFQKSITKTIVGIEPVQFKQINHQFGFIKVSLFISENKIILLDTIQ